VTETLGEQHVLTQVGLERLRLRERVVDRGVDEPGSDGVEADPAADRSRAIGSVMPTTPPLEAE
jgi:hypothetical protein